MSNLQDFKNNNVTINVVLLCLQKENNKPQIEFPFDGSLSGSPNELLTKILYTNFQESTQIKNRDINTLEEHIKSVLSENDYKILHNGILNDDYYAIINKMSFGHGIHNKGTKEFNLTSFASKFCAKHNQKAPFWDNLVSDLLNYLGYKYQYRNYKEYIMAFQKLQEQNNLKIYTLREIERAMWNVAKNST